MDKMNPSILLITPPFTQLNAPYPATAVLKGFLNLHNSIVYQADLGIELINRIFSEQGLLNIFEKVDREFKEPFDQNMFLLKHEYLQRVEPVKEFLKGKSPHLAYRIANRNFLPEGPRFKNVSEIETRYSQLGKHEMAKYLATLFIEDIADFIRNYVHQGFDLISYQSHLSQQAPQFDVLYQSLQQPAQLLDHWLCELLESHLENHKPTVVGFTVPFPGNLYGALVCARYIRKNYPEITIVFGGGYISTELRDISDLRFFEFAHYLIYDDGEESILKLLEFLVGKASDESLIQTLTVKDGKLKRYRNQTNISFAETGIPDFSGLPLELYFSLVENINPMHKLWSDGYWNKLTLAHGCYWAKCAFCDTSLDYIKRFDAPPVEKNIERIKAIKEQTRQTGFHFTDEAAPPALLKNLALALLRENLQITWWGNIRFEQAFTADVCRLLAASGCIAVTGGIETASDRLLKLMNKGVTLEQAAQVSKNFSQAGILVHAYLMYGFPSQTVQETVDSLEIVRQFFERNLVQSAFWHRFALTCHSPVGINPEKFGIKIISDRFNTFANNELEFSDKVLENHPDFQPGLNKATYNFMHKVGFDFPVQEWFSFKMPKSQIHPKWIAQLIKTRDKSIAMNKQAVWLGGRLLVGNTGSTATLINSFGISKKLPINTEEALWLQELLEKTHFKAAQNTSFGDIESGFYMKFNRELLTLNWFADVRDAGLLFL